MKNLEFGLLNRQLTLNSDLNTCVLNIKDDLKPLANYLIQGLYEDLLSSDFGRSILGKDGQIDEASNILTLILDNVAKEFKDLDDSQSEEKALSLLLLGVSCLQLFVQNNWVGPPTETNPCSFLPSVFHNKDDEMRAYVIEALSVDGEAVYRLCTHPLYLLMARIILLDCREYLTLCDTSDWWLMRCLQTQQMLLEERSPTLKATVEELCTKIPLNKTLKSGGEMDLLLMQFHLEAGHLLYFFYEPSLSHKHFEEAKKLAGISIELTGAMGKRTRYQEKEISQLILKVTRQHSYTDRNSQAAVKPPSEKLVVCSELPKDVDLDDDTVFNKIKITDEAESQSDTLLPVEQAYILAMCHEHRRSHEGTGDILREESMAFTSCILSERRNWCVLSTGLLLRTYWEGDSSRRMQRTMQQLEELGGQFNRPAVCVADRLDMLYAVKLPPIWTLRNELGHMLMKIGVTNGALDVYLSLEMWEDVIKCYKHLGRREKAEQVIREQLAVSETPSMWCYLGDVTEDDQYYQKAWDLSNSRYARAQKCMAYLRLRRGEFEECLDCFQKSLALNPMQIGVWFSYGCASLATKSYKQAADAFTRCVIIDTDNFEAWSNLATAHIRNGHKAKAFNCLQEAIKCEYENWRLWENYMICGTDIGEFQEVMRAYHRMLDKNKKHADTEVLGVLVRACNEDIPDIRECPSSQHRPKLLELFERLTSIVTSEAGIWKLYGELLLGGPEVSETDRHRAIQFFQKSHRCLTQEPEWSKDVDKCKKILQHTINMAKSYLQNSSIMDNNVQVIQMLSSSKLSFKSVLTNVKKSHTDPATQILHPDLASLCNDLETQLELILQTIEEKKAS